MKNLMCCLIFSILLVASCTTTYGPYNVSKQYGVRVGYGEGRHPGIDYSISLGTPIIAASDGEVVYVGDPCPGQPHCGDIFVGVRNDDKYWVLYGHLRKVFVEKDQFLKRGKLIGLSGASNSGNLHLHFGICKIGEADCDKYSKTLNPERFWLDGEPKCFNPTTNYSNISKDEITIPIACGDYAKKLIAEAKD